MKRVAGRFSSVGEVLPRQLRQGWFQSPNISTCENPRLLAVFRVAFVLESFMALLFGDL